MIMKTLIAVIALFPYFSTKAQGVLHVQNGVTLHSTGAIEIVMNDVHVSNDGMVNLSSSRVSFTGEERTYIFSFQHPLILGEVSLNKPNGSLKLLSDLSLTSHLSMRAGKLDLGYHDLTLLGNGQIHGESESAYVTGDNGQIIKREWHKGKISHPGNLGLEIKSDQQGWITVKRGHLDTQLATGESIKRYYEVSTEDGIDLKATLKFHYLDRENRGYDEAYLGVWKEEQSGFSERLETASVRKDQVNNWIEQTTSSPIGHWTIGKASKQAALLFQDAQYKKSLVPNQNSLRLYPNPATSELQVSFSPESVSEYSNINSIEVYTLSGIRMISTHGLGFREKIDVSNLPSGIYLLRYVNDKGKSFEKRFEVNR